MSIYNKLNDLFEVQQPVFLHPDERRDYTDEELDHLTKRDFETRLFITATPVGGDTVFLRTHHTDNAKHASHLNYIRDLIKATHSTKNWTCAKATLTTLLTMCFQLNHSDYATFATTVASGLSRGAKNTTFETNMMLVESKSDADTARVKFCLLMDIIFSKMATKKYLIDSGSCNIFRLVYCDTYHLCHDRDLSKRKPSLFVACFSFTLQICLTVYIILQNINTPREDYFQDLSMLPLAIFTFAYSFMVAIPSITETAEAYHILFRKPHMLQIMDFIVNVCIPLVLAASGFLVILCQNNFIDAVLNVTALLFIPEIDDQLPSILGLQGEDIILNFLIAQSMNDFDNILRMPDDHFNYATLEAHKKVCRFQFGDFYITNLEEKGINAQNGEAFHPYQVNFSDQDNGHHIDPSTVVTASCILRKIEWNYTTGFPHTTNRRVGRLQLTKINNEVVEIVRKDDPTGKVGINKHTHCLEGVFIITTFQMSEDIIKLRVCGSFNPQNFIEAFEYYSLWDITDNAKEQVNRLVNENNVTNHHDRTRVLRRESSCSYSRSLNYDQPHDTIIGEDSISDFLSKNGSIQPNPHEIDQLSVQLNNISDNSSIHTSDLSMGTNMTETTYLSRLLEKSKKSNFTREELLEIVKQAETERLNPETYNKRKKSRMEKFGKVMSSRWKKD
mmetsp:Transcript_22784/g.26235  ORF Transcript_22784/g.26235 Transcript_22784/m.26235 type:complete len:674 (-) Transcript_22784:82-2103(-)